MSRATCSSRIGQRDRLAGDAGREPVAVPALEDERQRLQRAGAEAQPAREPLRDLAVQREGRLGERERVGERLRDHLLADLRRPAGADVLDEEGRDLVEVAGVDERERRPRHDVVAVQLRRLGRVRGAAEGVQQRDVVRVAELLRGRAREVAQPDGEDRRSAARARAAARCPGRSRATRRRPPRRRGSGARRAPPGDASRDVEGAGSAEGSALVAGGSCQEMEPAVDFFSAPRRFGAPCRGRTKLAGPKRPAARQQPQRSDAGEWSSVLGDDGRDARR